MAPFGFLFAAILTAGDPVPSAPPPSDWAFAKELAEMPAKLPPRVGVGRVPWAKDRISRCFFSPIKRPPFNRDELLDDVDYYPDGYLARLANEGVNGLWLTVRFRELVTCPYFPADPQAPRRLAKLRRTVAACAKHGIKVWLFAIEPTSMADDDPFLRAHPEIAGARSWDGRFVSCLSAPATLDYLRAATRDIFTRVPGLGGLIQITSGERPTTCFSELTPTASAIGCPRCRARTPAELHAALTGALVAGMRDAGSDARMISWFYHPQKEPERAPWVAECARNLPDGVTLQYNFESGATREQVGKPRRGGDYWLSVPGPAEPFRTVAAAARSAGRSLGAKIQVSCSHEVATVPYVPVPGLLYRKYRAMRAEGVESVMQCWFFGNCPGVMNRAAGELSFSDFSEDEDAFLLRLARTEWGGDAAAVSRLWKRFSDGYAQYPLSNLLQYYGPFHASVMATLLPDVSLGSQARTWKPNETPSGDLIGEALMDFTLEDALAQTELMCAPLEDPAVDATLAELGRKYAGDRDRRRDLGVMKALKILFVGARDVFAYYLARREGLFASRERGDAQAARTETAKMRTILARADRMTGEMKSLCADDSRLGFHSEAEAHLYTVEMLDWRLRALARSRQRLDAIARELQAGRPWPLSDRERETDVWQATRTATGEIVIEGTAPTDGGDMEVRTYDLCGTCPAQVATGKADAKGRFRILLPKPSDDPRFRPAWIVIRRGGDFNNGGTKWIWPKRPEFPEPRLEQSRLTGDNFARLQVKGAKERNKNR